MTNPSPDGHPTTGAVERQLEDGLRQAFSVRTDGAEFRMNARKKILTAGVECSSGATPPSESLSEER
jgi:hypothetical protein